MSLCFDTNRLLTLQGHNVCYMKSVKLIRRTITFEMATFELTTFRTATFQLEKKEEKKENKD